jgi:DNA-binding NtrC family response regulator
VAEPKILLIEDDPAVRHGMAAFLRASGLDVDEADSCQKALERFRAVGHDIVVADYSLPDGTSLDILPQIKKLSEETPFVILTAHGSIDLAVKAIKDGAEQFLTKPVESKALLVLLRRLLQQHAFASGRRSWPGPSRECSTRSSGQARRSAASTNGRL